jgi:ubiquinone/menaquinone biosynthesis C-methylase UbiE
MSEANNVAWPAAAAAFDRLAPSYDELFTRSVIGRAMRDQVWDRLVRAFTPGDRVLELNCGTGEDAFYLGRRGMSVVACDASRAMIEVAERRCRLEAWETDVEFRLLANEDLSALQALVPFDGAFSNFSGLNCLADLRPLARDLRTLVKPGGHVLLCLSSRVCIGEWIWFLLHGQVKKAFRRVLGQTTAQFDDLTISVSYPTVSQVEAVFAPWFRLETRRAIGLFVPPSYVENWVRGHIRTFSLLQSLDRAFAKWPLLRDAGDHVLLEFLRCRH